MKTVHYTWKVPFNDEPNAHLVAPTCDGLEPDGVFDLMFDSREEAFDFLFNEMLLDHAIENGWVLVEVTDTPEMPITDFVNNKCILLVDNGAVFEGTLSMFQDCFFSNTTFNDIYTWSRSFFDSPVDFSWKMKEEAPVQEDKDKVSEVFFLDESVVSARVFDSLEHMDADDFSGVIEYLYGGKCFAVGGAYEFHPDENYSGQLDSAKIPNPENKEE